MPFYILCDLLYFCSTINGTNAAAAMAMRAPLHQFLLLHPYLNIKNFCVSPSTKFLLLLFTCHFFTINTIVSFFFFYFFCNDMAHTNNKADTCTRDMLTHSAVCIAYPKGKMTKCLKEADFIFKECVKETSGVNAGDASSNQAYPTSNSSSMAAISYTGQASNGDIYNNGKLASFVYDNGLRYRVRRPGPRGS